MWGRYRDVTATALSSFQRKEYETSELYSDAGSRIVSPISDRGYLPLLRCTTEASILSPCNTLTNMVNTNYSFRHWYYVNTCSVSEAFRTTYPPGSGS